MASETEYRRARDEGEREAFAEVLELSYGYESRACAQWLKQVGPDNVRVMLRAPDRLGLVGGLFRVPMAQYFGGRSVPTCRVTGVAIAPSHRGRGTATGLLRAELRSLASDGFALSTLWAATEPLYRRVGFQTAGGYYEVDIHARDMLGGSRDAPVRRYTPSDEEQVRQGYRSFASTRPGWLDRGPYVWERTRRGRTGRESLGFVVPGDGRLRGHCFMRHAPTDHGFHMRLTDLVYQDEQAARTLLAFLSDQRSLGKRIHWLASPDDPLLTMIRDRHWKLSRAYTWMLRIIDVAEALQRRGYPPVHGTLHLQVEDELLPDNDACFVLDVDGGRARVRRGGEGRLRLDVSALASLYSGPPPSCGDYF